MNVAFFLTPKHEVAWVSAEATLGQALEHLRARRHSAVPLLDSHGGYVGTLTEGDLLWHLEQADRPWREVAETTPLLSVARHMDYLAVRIEAEIEALIARALDQSFVPVVDDRGVFVGIVRRQLIIEHCARRAGLLPTQ
jgi:CBS-domain-containing membrane protein